MAMRNPELRRRIALEAARLMSEHGLRDAYAARRKAAARLGGYPESALPELRDIEETLREHQRLFQADDQPRYLDELRRAACGAMRYFARFHPRLVGAVLDGTADAHSSVCLHVFSESPESVLTLLAEDGISFAEDSRRLWNNVDDVDDYPVVRITRDGIVFDLTVLPEDAIRQAPLVRGSQRRLRRATLAEVERLLASAA
ncbi:MAG: hypothetical protein ACREPN_08360 [Rudaea sp.]